MAGRLMDMYRLLIVDDEEIECEGLRMLIECNEFPFQVETASSAEDAYDLFAGRRMTC